MWSISNNFWNLYIGQKKQFRNDDFSIDHQESQSMTSFITVKTFYSLIIAYLIFETYYMQSEIAQILVWLIVAQVGISMMVLILNKLSYGWKNTILRQRFNSFVVTNINYFHASIAIGLAVGYGILMTVRVQELEDDKKKRFLTYPQNPIYFEKSAREKTFINNFLSEQLILTNVCKMYCNMRLSLIRRLMEILGQYDDDVSALHLRDHISWNKLNCDCNLCACRPSGFGNLYDSYQRELR